MKKIFISLFSIGLLGAFVFSATQAFFSDTETSTDNKFEAGEIDLKVDNTSYYNGVYNPNTSWLPANLDDGKGPSSGSYLFFNFLDLKPGDYGEDTISLHAANNAWVCTDITLTSNEENGINEPEGLDGDTTDGLNAGELASKVNFIWWADDGDNVYENDETLLPSGPLGSLEIGQKVTVAFADSESSIWGDSPSPMPGGETKYVGKAWCFGKLTPDPVDQDGFGQIGIPGENDSNGPDNRKSGFLCDGSDENNITQSDSLTADISFRAYQARHNDKFLCNPLRITPSVTPSLTPTPIACVPGFATGVVDSAQGKKKNGTAVLADRSDPTDALGAPQSTGALSDNPVVAGSFFSLGFGETNIGGGSIILSFSNPIIDLPGFDFRIYEVTGGSYPDEKIKVEASQDNVIYQLLSASSTRDSFFNLGASGLPWASYLRITDVSDKSLAGFPADADGYDLDGVQTYCGTEIGQ